MAAPGFNKTPHERFSSLTSKRPHLHGQFHEDIGVHSDSDQDPFEFVDEDHEDFEEIARHELDPLRDAPLASILETFRSIRDYGRYPEQNKAEWGPNAKSRIKSGHLHWVRSNGAPGAQVDDIYRAWFYWSSDSGRVESKVWRKYIAFCEQTDGLAVPRWLTESDRRVPLEEEKGATWGKLVRAIEWYRSSELAYHISTLTEEEREAIERERLPAPKAYPAALDARFRLEDALDPISFLLLKNVFDDALSCLGDHNSSIGAKDALCAAFDRHLHKFMKHIPPPPHDHQQLDGDHSAARYLEISFDTKLPRDELYRGFLLYAQGIPRFQRLHHLANKSVKDVNERWAKFAKLAALEGKMPPAMVGLAQVHEREEAVFMHLSWHDWKARVMRKVDEDEKHHRDLELQRAGAGSGQEFRQTLLPFCLTTPTTECALSDVQTFTAVDESELN
ncbi:hypothetical protein JCM11641_007796 [Rhodosporidiobolus odoratus]